MPELGTLVWFEIPADDPERAKHFYGGLFGWKFEPFDDFAPDYWAIETGGGSSINGGIVPRSATVAPGPGPVVYAAVADLEAAAAEAVRLGGRVLQERTLITEQAGSFVLVADPEGNVVGLWSE